MPISSETRQQIRERYDYCCGYCGLPEISVGNELEIDHFQPYSQGGDDDVSNLVYACTSCNRYKANYWPTETAPPEFYLLHPLNDDFDGHIREMADGRLTGLTPRGWFHIRWLHLNRPQLVAWRLLQQSETALQNAFALSQETNKRLQQRVQELEREVSALWTEINRLR